MRAVIQRVSQASVSIQGEVAGSIDQGLLILVGIEVEDEMTDAEWLAKKIGSMRIFPDEEKHMNRSIMDVGGDILLISQFTLHASTKKGNRPSFIKAASPEQAIPLYEDFKLKLESILGKSVESGQFGADMQVSLINDGPVTINMDSKNKE